MANKSLDELKNIDAFKGVIGGKSGAKKELPSRGKDMTTGKKEEKKQKETKKEPVKKDAAVKEAVKEDLVKPVKESVEPETLIREEPKKGSAEAESAPNEKSPKEPKISFSVYFTEEESRMLIAATSARGMKISNYLKMLALRDFEENAKEYNEIKDLLGKLEKLKATKSF